MTVFTTAFFDNFEKLAAPGDQPGADDASKKKQLANYRKFLIVSRSMPSALKGMKDPTITPKPEAAKEEATKEGSATNWLFKIAASVYSTTADTASEQGAHPAVRVAHLARLALQRPELIPLIKKLYRG